jgi:CxxC motif-containing protein (DUF1111 family)
MEALDMRAIQLGFGTTLMLAMLGASPHLQAQQDPGPRPGADAGGMLPNVSEDEEQKQLFLEGLEAFNEPESIKDGFGPRFNLDSCGGCHQQPAVGGSSPSVNPQVALATQGGARNRVPKFLTEDGPIREVRFRSDGGVHALFVISGRNDDTGDASGCNIRQERFRDRENIIFRIPTPVFGAGLIEQISDSAMLDNQNAHADVKQTLGILGKAQQDVLQDEQLENTLGRFGWKAQHASLRIFAGEAYNVEMGITNELFETELEQDPDCQYAEVPNSPIPESGPPSDVDLFTAFMRGLERPVPNPNEPGGSDSIARGAAAFAHDQVGCALCHTPELAGVRLHSDLLLHRMGARLADGVKQGSAGPDEFRTAPLWGLGQRLFFLHDGRTKDLLEAILHHEDPDSEANEVIKRFKELDNDTQQDLLNFLRSL